MTTPSPPATGVTLTVDTVPTPALVIDAAVAAANIAKLGDYAGRHGLAVRPHTKTHKSVAVARAQLAAGASGLTVAKVGEAEALLPAFGPGAADLLVAYPAVDEPRTRRLAALDDGLRQRLDDALRRVRGVGHGCMLECIQFCETIYKLTRLGTETLKPC